MEAIGEFLGVITFSIVCILLLFIVHVLKHKSNKHGR